MKNSYLIFLVFTFILCAHLSIAQTFTKLVDPSLAAHPGDWYVSTPVDINNDYYIDLVLGGTNISGQFIQKDSLDFDWVATSNFVNTNGITPNGSIWADVDNDCDLDVFWPKVGGTSTNYLYSNNGDGTFSRINTGALITDNISANGGCWGDYDNDGLLDLFLPRRTGTTSGPVNWLYKNTGNFNFTRVDTGAISSVANPSWNGNWVDIDNDNDLDLFVCNRDNKQNELFINNGNGYFTVNDTSLLTNTNNNSPGCSWGDFNNDGFQDVFVANVLGQFNEVHKNNGDGTFTKLSIPPVTNESDNSVGSTWADFDNDGYLDLFVANQSNAYGKRNFLYRNNGNETFTKITTGPQYTELYDTYCVSGVDMNRDGKLDIIATARYNKSTSIFINTIPNTNFVNLSLLGSISNKSAIGSRVVIKTSLSKQMRTVNGNSGYNTHDDFSLHFGLGQDTVIDSMWVYWPSGSTCVFTNVIPNTFYNIGEGGCSLDTVTNASFIDSSLFLTTRFTNTSSGKINSYLWDFGDGDTSPLSLNQSIVTLRLANIK